MSVLSNTIRINNYHTKISLAYERSELLSFIKLMAAFIAYKEGNTINAKVWSKMQDWSKQSLPLQKEVGCSKEIANALKWLNAYKTGVPDNKNTYFFKTILKPIRAAIFVNAAQKRKLFETSNTTSQYNGLMNNIFSIINSDGDNAYNGLVRNISLLKDHDLSQLFLANPSGENEVVQDYLQFIKNLTGSDLQYLPKDWVEKLKKKPEVIREEWKKLSGREAKLNREAVLNIIRESGEHLMDADELKSKLEEQGMLSWRIPEGFDGKYDDKRNLYTKDGVQLNGTLQGGWFKWIKPKEGLSKVAEGQGVYDANKKDFQPLTNVRKSNQAKFDLVRQLLPRLNEYASHWRSDFAFESGKTQLLGAMAETILLTGGRVGSLRSAETGSGITVLRNKDVTPKSGGVQIKYIGKKGVDQTHLIKPNNEVSKLLIEYLLKLKEGKRPDDFLWDNAGERYTVDDLRDYLRNEVGFESTPHKIRHLKGTDLFLRYLKTNPIAKNATKAELENHLKGILTIIGNELGHIKTKDGKPEATWSTAAQNYVDPEAMKEVFIAHNKPIPNWVKTSNSNSEE
jgi:hypothetical protein